MSAFSLPIPPATLTRDLHRLTERSATTPGSSTQEPGNRNVSIIAIWNEFPEAFSILQNTLVLIIVLAL